MKAPIGCILAGLLLVGCGSEVDGGPLTTTLQSVAALDGDVSGDGVVTFSHEQIKVGQYSETVGRRGFISFDLAGLGSQPKVQTAHLRLYLANFNLIPYKVLGGVMVDSVDYGAALTAAAYSASPATALGKISGATADWKKWVELDVTQAVQQAVLAATGRAQFRLRHEIELTDESSSSYTAWASGDSENKPQLVVTYEQ